MTALPRIAVSGDAQAKGITFVLQQLPSVASRYEVAYLEDDAALPAGCVYLVEQAGNRLSKDRRVPRSVRRITFAQMRFRSLWPLAGANPYNTPDGGRIGPFPRADAFVIRSLELGVPPDRVLAHLSEPVWNATWPDMDALFKEESAEMAAADAACDVKIGSFILKNFRKTRLFWAPEAPSNALLCELVYRILHACFGREVPADRDAIGAVFAKLSARDVMSHVAIPIYPLVAEHFALEWYERDERYPYDGGSRTFEEYYRAMIESISSALAKGQPRQPADRG